MGPLGVFVNTRFLNTLVQLSLLNIAASYAPASPPGTGPKVSSAMRNELSVQ